MALSVGISCGSKIDVGGHELYVKAIVTPTIIIISIDDGPEITITDKQKIEVLPEVFVFAGQGSRSTGNRLAFIAPRNIIIHRIEKTYV